MQFHTSMTGTLKKSLRISLGTLLSLAALSSAATYAGPSRIILPATCEQSGVSFGLCWNGGNHASDLQMSGQIFQAMAKMEQLMRQSENARSEAMENLKNSNAK